MQKSVSKSDVEKAVKQCFGDSDISSIKEYKSGNINKMYEVKLKNGKDLMLRIYNEDWKVQKESFIYRDIKAHLDIPVPEIYCSDDTKSILPFSYCLMSKIQGMQINESYKKYKNNSLWKEAGEILAKLHHIKFHHYGWIVGNEINPSFNRWSDFVWNDIRIKMERTKNLSQISKLSKKVEHYLNNKSYLLNIQDKPSLLHKDYHSSHILTDKDKVTGIIDVEWAIAGHTENDFIKLELWDFKKVKEARDAFFTGYLNYGYISPDYPERKQLYELWHWINMVNISYEISNQVWLKSNLLSLENFLKVLK